MVLILEGKQVIENVLIKWWRSRWTPNNEFNWNSLKCYCGVAPATFLSRTSKNFNKEFLSCSRRTREGRNYFQRIDVPAPPQAEFLKRQKEIKEGLKKESRNQCWLKRLITKIIKTVYSTKPLNNTKCPNSKAITMKCSPWNWLKRP